MLDFLRRFFSSDEFMPHGHCYLWQPGIVWLHVLSDATIAACYTSIPFTLLYFARRRRDLPFHWMFLCFGLFIIACGATHVMEIVTLWNPVYWVSGSVKVVTALASLPTAVLLVQLVPRALALPSPEDMRRAHAALQVSETRFRGAIEAGFDAFFVMEAVRDEQGRVAGLVAVEMNGEARKLTAKPGEAEGGDAEEGAKRGRFSDQPELVAKHERVLETREPLDEEVLLSFGGGGPTWFHHQVVPVGDGVAVTLRNIAQRKRAEHARLLAAIVDSSDDAIIGLSMEGVIQSWNPGAERLYGYTSAEVIGRPSALLLPDGQPDDTRSLLERLRAGDRASSHEATRQRKDGSVIDVSVRFSPIRDEVGALAGASAIARDITASREADRKLKASLREKEALIKEVHHRVKNNLQVISSLLNLEAGRITDGEALVAFRASQSRVRSIALFHESVYKSKDLSQVDMAKYLEDLLRALRSTYGSPGGGVTAEVAAEGVVLGADLAIPLGLLANELVTNAYKHAFPGGRGRIEVDLRRRGEALVLQVSDDGVGLPAKLDIASTETLGLSLVHSLADQIGAIVEVPRGERGARFVVTSKLPA
jgi:PAS domain S-box-containing protein